MSACENNNKPLSIQHPVCMLVFIFVDKKYYFWTKLTGINEFYFKDVFMALPLYLTIAILVIHWLFYIRKPLNFLRNSILYMVTVFIATNSLTLVRMELHLIEKSGGHLDYLSFLLYRNLLLPAVIIIFINYYLQQESGKNKIVLFFLFAFLLVGFDWLNVFFGILKYTHWNLGFSCIVDAFYLLAALGVLKMLLYINVRESSKDENI
jgi:hypothetical protein